MDARDFWDGIAESFGYDYWAWGSAADWVAGIGTGAALLLAAATYSRESQFRRRRYADAVIMSVQYEGDSLVPIRSLTIRAQNTTDLEVYNLRVFALNPNKQEVVKPIGIPSNDMKAIVLPPKHGENVAFPVEGKMKDWNYLVSFFDAQGQAWYRRVAGSTTKNLPRWQFYLRRRWHKRFSKRRLA